MELHTSLDKKVRYKSIEGFGAKSEVSMSGGHSVVSLAITFFFHDREGKKRVWSNSIDHLVSAHSAVISLGGARMTNSTSQLCRKVCAFVVCVKPVCRFTRTIIITQNFLMRHDDVSRMHATKSLANQNKMVYGV